MRFYYAQCNTSYVDLTYSEYAELQRLICENSEIVEQNEDIPVSMIEDDMFQENELRIKELLRMSDDEFEQIILY